MDYRTDKNIRVSFKEVLPYLITSFRKTNHRKMAGRKLSKKQHDNFSELQGHEKGPQSSSTMEELHTYQGTSTQKHRRDLETFRKKDTE